MKRLGLSLLWLMVFCCRAGADDLLSVYRQAALEDPQVERAQEALMAVTETQVQAKAALFLPEASLNANVTGHTQNVQLSGDSTGESGRSQFLAGDYSLSLVQPILHYDRLIALEQSDLRIAQAEAEYAAAESALLLRVAERYFDVLAAEDNLRFAMARNDSLERGLSETRQRLEVGFLALTDVQEAQAGSDRARADAIEAEHLVRDAREGLREVTGRAYDRLAALGADMPLVLPDPANEEQWIDKALSQNLGLLAAERATQTAEAEIKRQWAGHLPTMDAVGNHVFSSTGGRFGAADVQDTFIGLSLNVPLYQGGRVDSRTRAAEHRHQEALAALKQERRSVRHAASKAFQGVVAGVSRVRAFQQALASSETALNATRAGFSAGRRTALDVILAEGERLRAQRDYARARYDYLLNTLRLKQAVGTLAPQDLIQVNAWLTGAVPANDAPQRALGD